MIFLTHDKSRIWTVELLSKKETPGRLVAPSIKNIKKTEKNSRLPLSLLLRRLVWTITPDPSDVSVSF